MFYAGPLFGGDAHAGKDAHGLKIAAVPVAPTGKNLWQPRATNRIVLGFAVVMASASCAPQYVTTLYPADTLEHTGSPPILLYTDYGTRGGPIQVTLPTREVLTGRLWFNDRFSIFEAHNFGEMLGLHHRTPIAVKATGPETAITCHGVLYRENGNGECRLSNGQHYAFSLLLSKAARTGDDTYNAGR
jgi:hypothetical protein